MTDWSTPASTLPGIVAGLAPGSTLLIRRDAPEARVQFSVTDDGATLRFEACNESPEDDERLRERGWVMVDEWSGVWRRELPLPAERAQVEWAVTESLLVLSQLWGHARSDGFGYLAWRDAVARPWWQFWRPSGESTLTFQQLGLPKAAEPDANS